MTRSKTIVLLFPGAWGNDTPERVLWWFEHPVAALRAIDPTVKIVPIVYTGKTFHEIVCGICYQLAPYASRDDAQTVAIAYSMGRQVLAAFLQNLRHPPFRRVAHIAGIPSSGVPVSGTLGVLRAAPAFFLRSFGGRSMPADVGETNRVLCGGTDEALASELHPWISPEPMWWKIADLFLPGVRVQTNPIRIPTFATVGTNDILVGSESYAGDQIVAINRPNSHHAVIRKDRPDIRTIWEQQACFLLEA